MNGTIYRNKNENYKIFSVSRQYYQQPLLEFLTISNFSNLSIHIIGGRNYCKFGLLNDQAAVRGLWASVHGIV